MRVVSRILAVVALASTMAVPLVAQGKPGLLTAEEVKKAAPKDYYYRGQSATVQTRNCGGIRATQDGKMVLACLVDTSGYSADIQQKYMGLLITEVKLDVGGSSLAPGEYGFGFTKGDKLVVTDVGANDLFSVATTNDDNLKRPVPLKIVEEGGAYKLYAGKKWVALKTE